MRTKNGLNRGDDISTCSECTVRELGEGVFVRKHLEELGTKHRVVKQQRHEVLIKGVGNVWVWVNARKFVGWKKGGSDYDDPGCEVADI